MNKVNPFAYNFDDSVQFKSYFDQREPSRNKTCETVFNHGSMETYRMDIEAPSPNIAHITGYEPLEEAQSESAEKD